MLNELPQVAQAIFNTKIKGLKIFSNMLSRQLQEIKGEVMFITLKI